MNSFFRYHKFYTTHPTMLDSSDNYVCRGIKRRTEHDDMLKLFTHMDFINRVDLTASTSYCAKLSQKNLSRLIWSYVKLNIQRKITHLFQKNPGKFDLIKHEISDSTLRWKSGTAENESDLKEFASTWLIIQTATLFWTVTLFSTEPWSGGTLLKREAYARRKITMKRLKETNLG